MYYPDKIFCFSPIGSWETANPDAVTELKDLKKELANLKERLNPKPKKSKVVKKRKAVKKVVKKKKVAKKPAKKVAKKVAKKPAAKKVAKKA